MAFSPIDLSEIFYLNHTLYMHPINNKFLPIRTLDPISTPIQQN